jgi:replicative DNA helicase
MDQDYTDQRSAGMSATGSTPQNVDAERRVLGSFLKDPALISTHGEDLDVDDFHFEPHRHLLKALKEVNEQRVTVDVVTVGEQLKKYKMLDAVGGPMFLGELLRDTGTTIGIEHHLKIVREKSLLRRMIKAATEVATQGYSPELDITQYLDDSEKSIFQVLTGQKKREIRNISEVLDETMELLQKQLAEGGQMAGIPTGFDSLDHLLNGLQKTDLMILAARPGMGKTSFALSIANNVALQAGKHVALFSLEMGAEQLVMRLLSSEAHVNLKELRGGRPSTDDFRRLVEAADRMASSAMVWIDDTPSISLAQVRARCRRLHLEGCLDVVIIDYLQLMSARSNTISREQQISEISRGLKGLAKELKVPVMALSQLNRSLEQRQDKRPMLSDLRESGAIEQDADIIMFVYRDEYYHPDSEDKGVTEIIVGKQRNGPTGTARVAFIDKFAKFGNLTPAAEF